MVFTAEYYDVSNSAYYSALSSPFKSQRLRVELLDHMENTLYRIEQDIDSSDAGKIVNNNTQGTRRSFSFNLVNLGGIYNLLDEDTFWFNRKFRVYLGIVYEDDCFWFSKGVYITQNANLDSITKTVSLNGVDKYAQLDGTLNVLQADEMDTVFEVGAKISNVIRDILMMNIGNDMVLDPIEPIIDPDIGEQRLYKEFTMSAGSYYGDFLTEVMTSFGCDIFYDTLGRLTVRRVFNDDRPYWYAFKAPAYEFNDEVWGYIAPSISIDMNGVNKIIVSTENVNYPNVSETAINNNPRSPLCASKIGRRTLPENGGIIYISLGDETIDTPETKCREYAEYRLMQETCLALEANFQCPPLYHLCEGDVVLITDSALGFDQEPFIINSITIGTSTEAMSITATNLKYLPTDIYNDAMYTYVWKSPSHPSYTLSYNLNGGKGTAPNSLTAKIASPFVAATGYDNINHVNTFYHSTGDSDYYEFTYWTGSNTIDYEPGETYLRPNNDTTLYANWADVSSGSLIIQGFTYSGTPTTLTFNSWIPSSSSNYHVEGIAFTTSTNKKYYFKGRGRSNDSVSLTVNGNGILKYFTDFGSVLNDEAPAIFLEEAARASNGIVTGIQFPSNMSSLDFTDHPLTLKPTSFITLPTNLANLKFSGDFMPDAGLSMLSLATANSIFIYGYGTAPTFMDRSTSFYMLSCGSNNNVTVVGEDDEMTFIPLAKLASINQTGRFEIKNVDAFSYAPDGEYSAGGGWDAMNPNASHNFKDIKIDTCGKLFCGGTYYDETTGDYEIAGTSTNTVTISGTLQISSHYGGAESDKVQAFCNASLKSISIAKLSISGACQLFNKAKLTASGGETIPITGRWSGNMGGSTVFNDVDGMNRFVANGEVDINTSVMYGSTDVATNILCNNADLTYVVFNNFFYITMPNNTTSGTVNFMCNNPNLTAFYLTNALAAHLNNLSSTATLNMFQNNHADFKVYIKNGITNQAFLDYLDNNNVAYIITNN